jgi:hypothetical protein
MDEPKMCVLCADRAERDRLREEVIVIIRTSEETIEHLRALNAELVEALKHLRETDVSQYQINIILSALSKAEQKGE